MELILFVLLTLTLANTMLITFSMVYGYLAYQQIRKEIEAFKMEFAQVKNLVITSIADVKNFLNGLNQGPSFLDKILSKMDIGKLLSSIFSALNPFDNKPKV